VGRIRILIKNDQRKVNITQETKDIVRKCCAGVLSFQKMKIDAEVSVTFVSDRHIRRLNRIYREKDKTTDVLSFPLFEKDDFQYMSKNQLTPLGDIVISIDTALKQAEEYGHSLEREVGFLTVHSMLHLLGYDHETSQADEDEMFAKQKEILDNIRLMR
jgi:probable rRNA maturation factor